MQRNQPSVLGKEVQSPEDSVLAALLAIGRLMRQRVGTSGLEPGTFWLLNNLRSTGAQRVTELAARIQLDASTVSRHIQQLEKSELVERAADPLDGRAQIVDLTEVGRAVLETALDQRRAALVQHFADWDHADVLTLERLLNRFVEGIDTTVAELEQS